MPQITIVGLGPGAPDLLTRQAWGVLSEAQEIWVRTARHPITPHLPPSVAVHAFDDLYEQAATFEQLYATIAERVLALGQREAGVTYAVPGHPLVGEATVTYVLTSARAVGVPVHIVEGVSFIEPTLTALELDALEGLQIIDALDVVALHHPPFNPDRPALVAQVYSRAVASDLKLVLMNQYPDEHPTALIHAVGTPAERVERVPLYEIDRQPASPLTSLYVAPMAPVCSFEGFQETVAHLRAPDGCPWDREQTHASLRSNVLEEAYEVLAAIDAEDPPALREELGDLLLQVVLQAQIAVEEGQFRMADVIAGIDAKLKHRHPHVWGDTQVEDADEVTVNWEVIKQQEREDQGETERSLLDGVPEALPALAQAHAYVARVARVGFEWETIEDVVAKVEEELQEVRTAQTPAERSQEVGDLLLAIANWARWMDVDPESALREANARFARRFRRLMQRVRQQERSLAQMAPEEILQMWDRCDPA
jgi:tetrapyrrole methylase family protein/MazG family protein